MSNFKRQPKLTLLVVIKSNSSIFDVKNELISFLMPVIKHLNYNSLFASLNIVMGCFGYQKAKLDVIGYVVTQYLLYPLFVLNNYSRDSLTDFSVDCDVLEHGNPSEHADNFSD
jgi:hypothetical protein